MTIALLNLNAMSGLTWTENLQRRVALAHRMRFTFTQICNEIGLKNRQDMTKFMSTGYLGSNKKKLLEEWLNAHGVPKVVNDDWLNPDKPLDPAVMRMSAAESPVLYLSDSEPISRPKLTDPSITMVVCRNCSEWVPGPPRFIFCGACGEPLGRQCDSCGHLNIELDAKFCSQCGSELDSDL
jgi:hypothetical protein